jgi:3',5'-cyclic-AMP phosphodiesterase
MPARLIQITDCHLFADPHAQLKEISTRSRLEAVLKTLREERATTDRLIVSGDLTHDDLLETYRLLHDLLDDWLPIVRVIPGNHDDRAAMREVFGKSMQHVDGRNVFVDEVGGWKLIGLDSQVTGSLQGRLDRPQRDWLDQQLTAASDSPAAIFVHHPPVRVGSAWLDQVGLEDGADLLALLERHPQVKVISCGHIHQEMTSVGNRPIVLATPATGVQFRPARETLVVDSALPGFRVLELEADGTFRTRVVRVPCD